MDATYNDSSLRSHLGLDGTVTFESHTNLGITDDSLSESMEQASIGSRLPSRMTRRRKARGKGNRGDQFCIYWTSDDQNVPAVAIEYKALYKLRRGEIVAGLVLEIWPDCNDGAQPPTDDSEDDDDDESPSPTPNPTVGRSGLTTSTDVGSSEMQEHDETAASQEGTIVRPNIQDQSYCMHITLREFLRLVQAQLAGDRGKDADCMPLYLSGSRGSLFKFRLSSHGYTLVAKGVEIMTSQSLTVEAARQSYIRCFPRPIRAPSCPNDLVRWY
ncbi:serine threonine protein kinase [Fusarium bulbicola]|nr:serine threonine protein kinase [Fusarium bulbicola]